MDKITSFRGEHEFLSNMYPCDVVYNGTLYANAEAAFQAAKCFARAREFVGLDGKAAKRLGRKVELSPDWEDVKIRVMKEVLVAKFGQNLDLYEKLHATGAAELVEGNTWNDTFWGVCNGKGENHLGKILESLRTKTLAFPRVSARRSMERLQELWDARTGDTFAITIPFYGVAFEAAPAFENGADDKRVENALWISLHGPSVANAIEDDPLKVADRLADFTNVMLNHDEDLSRCLRYARSQKGKPVGSYAFTLYSDWYKSLMGDRPHDWDDLEKALTDVA